MLVNSIYEHIYEDIMSGKLLPGQKLHIAQLARDHQVGQSPVREALSRLLATEFVNTVSQRGFTVAPVSSAELYDIYRTRAHIEAIALKLSIENGSDEWEAEMISAYHLLAKFESTHTINNAVDYKEWGNRHRSFNLALINACPLNHLLRLQEHLYNLTERYRRQWLNEGIKQPGGVPYAKGQKKIMDAALERNTELATELLHKHFEKAIKLIAPCFSK